MKNLGDGVALVIGFADYIRGIMRVTGWRKIIVMFRIIMTTLEAASLMTLGLVFRNGNRSYINKKVHIWNQKMLQIVRAKYKIFNPYGFEFKPDRSYVVMSNHLSLYDIPLIFATFPGASVRMIAKKELYRIPVFGWGIRAGECVSIDRTNHRQAVKDLALAKQKILSGIKMWIAPEGTRSRTGNMGEFKKGGFKLALGAKAIIVPVAIIGSNKILPPGTFDFSVGETVEMHICKPIDTMDYSLKDLPKLMEDTASEIKEAYYNKH
ncbi:MAG: 1-acyl-sn-glycerol-3-phosphate acetyltransferase [uncultured bacterium]|nr:MAG: 1-acyl-sn-glycerol-3-phosphate acetyltransferase [uncultured bacterium]